MNIEESNGFGLTKFHPFENQEQRMFALNTVWRWGLYPPNVIVPWKPEGGIFVPVNNYLLGGQPGAFVALRPYAGMTSNTATMPTTDNKYSNMLRAFISGLMRRDTTSAGSTSGTF